MKVCKNCGELYAGKSCPRCKPTYRSKSNQNLLLIIIAISTSLIALISIINESKKTQEEKLIKEKMQEIDKAYDALNSEFEKSKKMNEEHMKFLQNR